MHSRSLHLMDDLQVARPASMHGCTPIVCRSGISRRCWLVVTPVAPRIRSPSVPTFGDTGQSDRGFVRFASWMAGLTARIGSNPSAVAAASYYRRPNFVRKNFNPALALPTVTSCRKAFYAQTLNFCSSPSANYLQPTLDSTDHVPIRRNQSPTCCVRQTCPV